MSFSIHVDCDSLWACAQEYGLRPDYSDGAIYETALPRFLDVFAEFGVHATFFVIGRDLDLPACGTFCRAAIEAGHRIGNHSFTHPLDFRALSAQDLRQEIVECHRRIHAKFGYRCRALRLPGYYFDSRVAEVMGELEYDYDSSVLPGFGVYLMTLFYRLFNPSGQQKRFGQPWYLFARRTPFRIRRENGTSAGWEVPIAVFPVAGLPLHSTFAFQWGMRYVKAGLTVSRGCRDHVVYLFHAVDLLDSARAGDLASRMSTLKLSLERRENMVWELVNTLSEGCVRLTEEMLAESEVA